MGIGIILDQLIKYIIDAIFALHASIPVIADFFSITYVRNYGAAFSMLDGNRFLLIMIGFLALGLLYVLFLKGKKLHTIESVTYGLLISGIVGNLMDRIGRGYVIDYLDFTLFGYSFPVFNVADICIVISVVLLIIMIIKEEIHGKNRNTGR